MQPKIRFDIITLFPEACLPYTEASILKRAKEALLIEVYTHQLRDFALDKHKTVDDTPYGGGAGMVLKVEPLVACLEHVIALAPEIARDKTRVIVTSAKGEFYTQRHAERLASQYERIVFVCGRYEGIDQRFIDHCVDEEFSIGEYVLTGGELPALIMLDSMTRLVPGVLGNEESSVYESYSEEGGREHPQYTKPEVYRDWSVPSILLSGNHKAIDDWRTENRKPL
ncbi:MAG: tRNA (guanosine(37)-N1)-methyltransferase TrmD [Candidatus Moranbacteria bacterium]|nr:tRNA (guanosine(37)-N1)-methyltransferase TrmD [Candidatus Moranbacteria bacterium]